jgi:CBS domain-containing protein
MADKTIGTGRTVLASELMTTPVLTTARSSTVSEAAALMLVNRVGSIVIVEDNGDYAGMLTERMLLPEEALLPFMRESAFRLLGHEVGNFENMEEVMDEVRGMSVGNVMNTRNPTAEPDTHVGDIARMMVDGNSHHVCILQGRKPVGMVSRHDLLRLLLNPAGGPLRKPQ